MSIELHQVSAQANAIQATDELIVSDRSTVAGTGYRAFTAILRAMSNYVGALASTDLVPVKTATGTGWRAVSDIVNSGPINHQEGSGNPVVTEGVTGDATFRVRLLSNGRLEWADGATAADVGLYRGAAGALVLSGRLTTTALSNIAATFQSAYSGGLEVFGTAGVVIQYPTSVADAWQVNTGGYARAVVDATGVATFKNGATAPAATASETVVGGGRIRTYENVVSEAGGFFTPNSQGLYIGGGLRFSGDVNYTFVNSPSGSTKMYVGNADSYYDNGSHRFRNAAGTADGTIYAGDLYRGGSWQPVSTVSFININASTYWTVMTVPDGSAWELTVGNASEGYMARATFGKPSATSGAVLLSEVHSNASLTITLSGNDIRVNNGVASTRTTYYSLTRLY